MAAKGISQGTLGLRFMQRAQLSKQTQDGEIQKAPIKDDGQWEVNQEVRDAWASVATSSSQTISHESSYLPFLFSSESSSEPSSEAERIPKGRRQFNNYGAEQTPIVEPEAAPHPTTPDVPKKFKVHPRPKGISHTPGTLSGFPETDEFKPAKNAKTAKQAIYDNTGVGDDLRRTKQHTSEPPTKPTFLKPAGVDDPLDTKPSISKPNTDIGADLIMGARSKKGKLKRRNSQSNDDGTKRKKKNTS